MWTISKMFTNSKIEQKRLSDNFSNTPKFYRECLSFCLYEIKNDCSDESNREIIILFFTFLKMYGRTC